MTNNLVAALMGGSRASNPFAAVVDDAVRSIRSACMISSVLTEKFTNVNLDDPFLAFQMSELNYALGTLNLLGIVSVQESLNLQYAEAYGLLEDYLAHSNKLLEKNAALKAATEAAEKEVQGRLQAHRYGLNKATKPEKA